MNNSVNQIWDRVLKIMKYRISDTDFNSWLVNVKPIDINNVCVIVEVDNKFIKDTVEDKFKDMIIEIINDVLLLDGYRELKINIRDSVYENNYNKIENEKVEIKPNNSKKKLYVETKNNLNRKYIFETFIVGKSNEFAHAVAEAVAKSPGKGYNPLFIYGGVGLGKTHLMHAIGNYVYNKDKSKKIFYCPSEQFTNDLINSIKNDKMSEFRAKYRKLDVILIDDIQFIAGKDSTQEEFFHTFNELHQAGKQIVLSSDRPPKEINNVEKRLVSRFEWGLIADIQPPDYETRVAILKNKSDIENLQVSEDIIRYIAEVVNSNIRELEGALNRIVAKASLLKRDITIDLVEDIFKDIVKDKARVVTKDKIINVVSEYYGVTIEEMKSSKRKKDIALARQVSMYFLRELLEIAFTAIGEEFGGKDHTTVMHSVSKIEGEIKKNGSMKKDLEDIKQKIFI